MINEDNILTIEVSEDDNGSRLDAFIGYNTDELSRSYAVRLIEKGSVTVNGSPVTSKKHNLKAGDKVSITIPEPEVLDIQPEDITLEIVYEDSDVIVVNKPRGLVVHPGPGNWSGTLVNALMYHCGDSLSSINGVIRPGIVHRIDKDTSGLLMIAKNDMAHESLAAQLKVHSVTREYTALVFDNIREDEITIDAPIGRDERNRMRRAVYGSGSKDAVTHIRVTERFGRYTLIKARLETGRTHQIRVHMASIRHPLVGDELYGPHNQPDKLMGCKLNGQLLHAGTLGFVHPGTGEYMEFHSELPEVFAKVLEGLRTQTDK
ncbi:MAG: RluA family pseudouridine synthase [Mogibacterium sp.]|nr:RluA family pseudouridine synthase [Mogibacterium sp.]